MARKTPTGKAIGVLLVLCLLMGAGGSGLRAEDGPGVQLVVVLDSPNPAEDSHMNNLVSQAASLLVYLLGDQDYLGLIGSGQSKGMLLPTAGLTSEHRKQALDTLGQFSPTPDQTRPSEVLQQALGAFQPRGPQRRVLFWLAGQGGLFDAGHNDGRSRQIEEIAAQARSAGVSIFAALTDPASGWRTLTSNTGGRFWEIKAASDLLSPCLELYQYLSQPQEAPIDGSKVLLDRWVEKAVLVMTRSDPDKGVVLTDPGKVRYTDRTRARNIRWVPGRSCDLIILTRPRPGVWSFIGGQAEVCKVFLSTDLILTAAGTPRQVAEDEALLVTAALQKSNQAPVEPRLLAGTEFSAEIRLHDTRLTAALKAPNPDQNPASTPDVLTGRFAPLHQEGQGTLRLMARGKNFQRLRELPLTITAPWYRVTPAFREEAPAEFPLRFQPDPERRPEQVAGTLTLKSTLGSLSGIFISPPPGAEIIVERSRGQDDFSWADLRLKGTAPDGRPLATSYGPLRLQAPQNATDKPLQPPVKPDSQTAVQDEKPAPLIQALSRRWVWLTLCALGAGFLLVTAFLMWRLRRETENLEGEEDLEGPFPSNVLRLKAQVETLVKEKGELEVALKEKNQQIQRLQEEKSEMQKDLDRIQDKYQANLKALKDLEKQLEETQTEAQRVQEEYTALYARSQMEQETLKKN